MHRTAGCVAVVFALLLVLRDGAAQSPPAPDAAGIADPKAKAAVEQILKALAVVREYTCTVKHSGQVNKGPLSMTEQFWYKAPFVLNVQTNTEHPVAVIRGNTSYYYSDGITVMVHQKPGPGALQAYTEMFSAGGRTTPAQAQQMAANSAKPKATRYDLAKLSGAGIKPYGLFFQELITRPFADCDMKTLKLEGETADAWTISGEFNYSGGKAKSLLTIGKKNGVTRTVVTDGALGKNSITIQDVRINPSPGIPPATFQYAPPAGVTVTDGTDMLIQSQQRQAKTPM